MKQFRISAAVIAVLLALAACTTAQTDKLVGGLNNFNRGLAAVDQTLANINSTLYAQCNSMVTVSAAINDLASQCSKASPYTSTANAVISNYCQSSQLAANGGIAASIQVTATSVSAAKSTLAANKKACAS